jgi:hypothetical protein
VCHSTERRHEGGASADRVDRDTSRSEGEIMRIGVGVMVGIVIGVILVLWLLTKVLGGIF